MKINEKQLRSIIKSVIKEQRRNFFDYMHEEHPEENLGDKKFNVIYDKMEKRKRDKHRDGQKEYQLVNPENHYAKTIFKYSTPETVNDVVKNCKRQTGIRDLQRYDGEDKENLGWETFPSKYTGEPMGVNSSKMQKAKLYYILKDMTPKERGEYIKKHFKGRFGTVNGLDKLTDYEIDNIEKDENDMKLNENDLRSIVRNVLCEMNCWDYPAGADTSDAPWNEPIRTEYEPSEEEVDEWIINNTEGLSDFVDCRCGNATYNFYHNLGKDILCDDNFNNSVDEMVSNEPYQKGSDAIYNYYKNLTKQGGVLGDVAQLYLKYFQRFIDYCCDKVREYEEEHRYDYEDDYEYEPYDD